MLSPLIVTVARAAILVGMVLAFAISLGFALVRDQRAPLLMSGSANRDPGVRVLLTDRRVYEKRTDISPLFERVSFDVLRPCWLLAPERGDNPEYVLKVEPGEQLLVKPDVDGVWFSSQTWGQEQRWPVASLRLLPREPGAGVPRTALDQPTTWTPGRFEDSARQAVATIGGRRYRGCLDIRFVSAKALQVINTLPIEAYVEGVISVEMKPSYPLDALKAQAVVSRSYAYARAWKAFGAGEPYDLTDHLDDQDYYGHGLGGDLTVQAVRDTAGMILVTPGLRQPFVAYCCAASGGWTESIDQVFPGSTDVAGREQIGPLMPLQRDPFCERAATALGNLSTHWEQQVVLRPEDIQARLQAWYTARGEDTKVGFVTDLSFGQRDPQSNRVRSVVIAHTPLLKIELPAAEFRAIIGPSELRSTLWTSLESRMRSGDRRVKDFVIGLRGWGHGVGLSQISAWAMAQEGFEYRAILQAFFPGAEIQSW